MQQVLLFLVLLFNYINSNVITENLEAQNMPQDLAASKAPEGTDET